MTRPSLFAAVLALPIWINCVAAEAPATSTVDQDSQYTFVRMLAGQIGLGNALALDGYGCYCGLGNDVDVIPVDATDNCCMTHDYAWMGAAKVAPGCDCNNAAYTFANTNGVITCAPNQGACAAYCCAADQAFTACVQANPPVAANQAYDRSTCAPLECVVDADCESGTWCDGGRCAPMCGGTGIELGSSVPPLGSTPPAPVPQAPAPRPAGSAAPAS